MKRPFSFLGFFKGKPLSVEPQMTQLETIMMHLKKRGSITSWEAIKEYNITRLSAVIFKLKNDLDMSIKSTHITDTTEGGKIKRYTVYTLDRR